MRSILLTLIGFACVATSGANPLTVTVEGNGYLRFMSEGKMQYAKSATLVVIDGRLCAKNGAKLVPTITVSGTSPLDVSLDGTVTMSKREVGRIVLALFAEELTGFSEEGFAASALRPNLGNPGEGENGVIRTVSSVNRVAVRTAPETPGTTVAPKVSASLATDIPSRSKTGTESNTIHIKMSDKVEIGADLITLGEIADISAPKHLLEKIRGIELGTTPMIPVERIVERTRIVARLRASGIDPDLVSLVGPEKIRVQRKGQLITQSQFVEVAIRGSQLKGYGSLESQIPGPDLKVPVGELELVCESVSGSNTDLSVTIGVYVDGKRFNSRTVKLKSTVPAMSLKVGAIVSVRVKSGAVSVESKGKVVRVDPSTGTVTVTITDTGAQLTGTLAADGAVEVKA